MKQRNLAMSKWAWRLWGDCTDGPLKNSAMAIWVYFMHQLHQEEPENGIVWRVGEMEMEPEISLEEAHMELKAELPKTKKVLDTDFPGHFKRVIAHFDSWV